MTLFLFISKWREILIGLLAFLLIVCLALLNHKTGQLKEAQAKCAAQIQAIEQQYLKALTDKQNKINKASVDYEQLKSEQRIITETKIREVQKIIERPVYNNVCIDDDGLHIINSLIPDDSS
ncbi:hypothetical protein KTI63_03115 [Acinetobacter guillouiae]|uniref:hypothetical protein n=1 Tax=Acinetobacter guillouiae TaxID=106649 RepID=UPI0021D02DDD|nr:hypothetical protein [Acinetobacter guillouiae]MCU4491455.1 hypothetical protein [Acinetobacter guillouiae]